MFRYAPLPASDSPYQDQDEDKEDKVDYPPATRFLPSSHHRSLSSSAQPTAAARARVRRALLASALCLLLLAAAYSAAPRWRHALDQDESETPVQAELVAAEVAPERLHTVAHPHPPASLPPAPSHAPPVAATAASSECTNPPLPVRPNNVNPNPRPPPPCTSKEERYLTYENHSGFYNQLSSLTNALFLAEHLNRTLLLPPARLGVAAAWKPDLRSTTEMHERCKALATQKKITDARRLPAECQEKHSDPSGWTYMGWDAVFRRDWLAQWDIVDRWDGSLTWLGLSREKGGMGFEKGEMYSFEGQDTERLGYQIYETRGQPDSREGAWAARIDLPDLVELPQYRDAKLLHFGSLFGEGRLDLGKNHRSPAWARRSHIQNTPIIQEDRLDGISDEIKARIGSYIGIHLRTTDGSFRYKSQFTFPKIFKEIATDLLGVHPTEVKKLLALSAPIAEKMGYHKPPPSKGHGHKRRRGMERRYDSEDEGDEEADDELWFHAPDSEPEDEGRLVKRAHREFTQSFWPTPSGYERPVSNSVTCRGKLYPPSSPLYALNHPLYIATDAREPLKEAAMVHFFQHFPCVFILSDFGFKNKITQAKTVRELEGMFRGERKSDWDGQKTAPRLFGFLDAMLAAKGDAMIGTPSSSFSAYAFDLHKHYVAEWKAAGPPHETSAAAKAKTGRQPREAPIPLAT